MEVAIAGNSPLGKIAGGGFSFGVDIHASPAQSISTWALALAQDLRRQRAGGNDASAHLDVALASPANLTALDRFRAGIAAQLPRFATTNALPPLNIVNPRDWAGAGAPVILSGDDGFGARNANKRPPATPVLRAELALHAFSPLYDPATPGDGPVVEARRQGGFAASGRLEFLPETAGRAGGGQAELAVTLGADQPRLLGRIRNLNLPTPFAGLNLQNAQADFDNQAATFLRARASLPGLALGPLFRLESSPATQPLAVNVALRQVTLAGAFTSVRTDLELAPVRLASDVLGGRGLMLHGPGNVTNPVSIAEGRWLARASFTGATASLAGNNASGIPDLVLRANLAGSRRDVVRLTGLPANPFAFDAQALDQFTARFDAALPQALTVELFPGQDVPGLAQRTLTLRPAATDRFQFEFGSDGTFVLVAALADAYVASAPGLFNAGAEVRLDATGATVSGRLGNAHGTLRAAVFNNRIEARFNGQLTLPALSALGGRITLTAPVGGFGPQDLRALRLSGNLQDRSITLAFDADLRLADLLAVPVRGTLGSAGLSFTQTLGTTRLLGFDFSSLRLGATNALGDLPEVAFGGLLPALPAPLNTVEFTGTIPGAGGFSLRPVNALDLPALVPGFPLTQTRPALTYRAEPYPVVVRADDPSGYWSLDDAEGPFLDRRLLAFRQGIARRSGDVLGAVTRAQDCAFATPGNRAARFDGASGHVRLPHDALSPQPGGLTVSLWFRRPNNLAITSPQTLAGRGSQWSLHLREAQAGAGTRVQFQIAGLQNPNGTPAAALAGRTRVDNLDWHHVVALHNGAAQFLYLDGRLEAWQPVRGSIAPVAGLTTALAARVDGANASQFFAGWFDEVAIFPGPLSPVDALAHWQAGGRGGLTLEGQLGPNLLPGLASPSCEGILSPTGDLALTLSVGGGSEFAGVRFPAFQGTLLRAGPAADVTFRSELLIPGLDTQSLGTAQGGFSGDGTFQAAAASLADRGVFGWNLRLTSLLVTGNWRNRTAMASVGARLTLPHDILTLAVGGEIDTARSRYTLRGAGGLAFPLGPNLSFTAGSPPVLGPDLFKLPGSLKLGPQADAAAFNTDLEIQRSGDVLARFSGTTGWKGFPGIGFGQLSWRGRLAYENGQPEVDFVGVLGMASPEHPATLLDLPEGLKVNRRGTILTSLRTSENPIVVNAIGKTSVPAEPAFLGKGGFDFQVP